MLSIRELTKRYGPRTILDRLSLVLAPGSVLAIVGESGAGKSTLLNVIAGLESADAGQVCIAGTDLSDLDDDARTRLRCRSIGFVFQAFHVLAHLTAQENVELPLVLLGTAARERRARAMQMLAAVGLGDRPDALPRELSGGELQRVAIARALVHRPALVLADEPTGNLDPDAARTILEVLVGTARAGHAAVVVVTHSERAAAAADHVLRLEHGRLVTDAASRAAPL